MISALEDELLSPDRLLQLLSGLLDLSDSKRKTLETSISSARAEKTRLDTAIRNLLMLVEDGHMSPRDPHFAERMALNRSGLAQAVNRIEVLERQLTQGKRRIDESTIERFGSLISEKLREKDNTLRSAYIKMFVDAVTVSDTQIVISGQISALEAGVSTGIPVKPGMVPSFDRPEELSARRPKRLISQENHRLTNSPRALIVRSGFVEKAGHEWTGGSSPSGHWRWSCVRFWMGTACLRWQSEDAHFFSVHEAAMLSEGLPDPLVLTERPAKAMGEHSRRQLPAPVDADL
ncbi:MAG: hypothetical protein B7X90_10795 [Novosphingobium sp. 17-62-19]|nr:MAG: hypothetical protein B7X90_10795 [Novosphingobium sp. 17-62-19]